MVRGQAKLEDREVEPTKKESSITMIENEGWRKKHQGMKLILAIQMWLKIFITASSDEIWIRFKSG